MTNLLDAARPTLPSEVDAIAALLPVGMRLVAMDPHRADLTDLHTDERQLMDAEATEHRREFAAGRQCARTAMGASHGSMPLLRRPDSGPAWPADVRGSISHKPGLCVAVVAPSALAAGIGIDLEPRQPLPHTVWSTVFTDTELLRFEQTPGRRTGVHARLCFSAKESYFKWYRSQGGRLTPDFHDVQVDINGAQLCVRPMPAGQLPPVHGRFVRGETWLITVLWSAAPRANRPASTPKFNNSMEAENGYNTDRPAVHP